MHKIREGKEETTVTSWDENETEWAAYTAPPAYRRVKFIFSAFFI